MLDFVAAMPSSLAWRSVARLLSKLALASLTCWSLRTVSTLCATTSGPAPARARQFLIHIIRNEDLDFCLCRSSFDSLNAAREMEGALVGEIVPVHRRYDRVIEPHLAHRLRERLRLVLANRSPAFCRLDSAECAAPRANIPEDHERGGAAAPALALVRAMSLVADGMEAVFRQDIVDFFPFVARGQPHLDPFRLGLESRRFHGASIDKRRRPRRGRLHDSEGGD